MSKNPMDYLKAALFAVIAYILMSLFWNFLESVINMQSSYLSWSWNVVRKLTTWGFAIIFFFSGLGGNN